MARPRPRVPCRPSRSSGHRSPPSGRARTYPDPPHKRGRDALQRARPLEHQGGTLDAQCQLYDSCAFRGVQVSRRSLLSREAGSLVAHTNVLRLLIENAGRSIPPEVSAALLTVEGWAIGVVATEINEPQWNLEDEDTSILMAEIRSTLAIMPDRKLEPILRDLPYRRMYALFYEVFREYREDK